MIRDLSRALGATATLAVLLCPGLAAAQEAGVPVMDVPGEVHLGVIEGATTASQTILGGIKDVTSSIKESLGPATSIGQDITDAAKTVNNAYKTVMGPIDEISEAVRTITDIPGKAIDTLTGGLMGGLGGGGLLSSIMRFYNLPDELKSKFGALSGGINPGASFNWYNGVYGWVMNPYTGQPQQLSPGQAYYVSQVVPSSYPQDFSKVDQVRTYSQTLFYDTSDNQPPLKDIAARRDLRAAATRNDQLSAYTIAMSMLGTEDDFGKLVTQVRTGKTGASNMRTDIMYNTQAILINVEALQRLEKILATHVMSEASKAMAADPTIAIGASSRVTTGASTAPQPVSTGSSSNDSSTSDSSTN
jgi:hypothetical protein